MEITDYNRSTAVAPLVAYHHHQCNIGLPGLGVRNSYIISSYSIQYIYVFITNMVYILCFYTRTHAAMGISGHKMRQSQHFYHTL